MATTGDHATDNDVFAKTDATWGELKKHNEPGFGLNVLTELVGQANLDAKIRLEGIKNRQSAISISDMFDMQLLMNHLSQVSEMSASVVSAAQTTIMSMARKISG